MAGKVLIVNGSGGKQHAITINPSAAQTVASMSGQNPLQSKPFLLLPNNGKVNNNIQPHHTVVNSNAVRMIVAQNNPAIHQMRSGAVLSQHLSAPVSLSNFQNIRPKATPQAIRSLQSIPTLGVNKVVITQPKSMNTTTPQFGATKTIPMQTLLQGSQANSFVRPTLSTTPFQQLQNPVRFSSVTNLPNVNSITVSKVNKTTLQPSVSIVKSNNITTNNALSSTFDKTMSQHLLELEKTDPHLFKGSKLTIAQSVKTPKSTNQSSPLITQQDKIKLYLQQQQQQHQQKQTVSANTQINVPQTKILTQQQATTKSAMGARPLSKITSSMPQLLSSLHQQSQNQIKTMESVHQHQQQQATLQDALMKQKLLLAANKQQQQQQQPSQQQQQVQQQQQQLVSQLLAAAASNGQLNMQQKQAQQAVEMYLLQQKLIQV